MEVLVIVSVIGILATLIIPKMRGVLGAANKTKNIRNAQEIAAISETLSAMSVAHVVPESMGGVKATARLISVGVIVPDGRFRGKRFQVSGLTAEEIDNAIVYLDISYTGKQLNLEFLGNP